MATQSNPGSLGENCGLFNGSRSFGVQDRHMKKKFGRRKSKMIRNSTQFPSLEQILRLGGLYN
jgi:hypothetical protein